MKKYFFIGIGLFAFASVSAYGAMGMELIPKGRPFRMTFLDPREIRMAITFDESSKINAAIGNYFSILGIRPTENSEWLVHFGLEGAGYFTMRQADSRFPLESADGLIGTYFETKYGPWQYQLRYTHISAHLADGSSGTSIAYSRETLSGRVGFVPSNDIQLYSGIHYLVNSTPKVPGLGFQIGGTYFLPIGNSKFAPFTGFDLRHRREAAANPNLTVQFGIALNNPPEAYRSFRFFYSYYTGADPRGQFYDKVLTSHAIGIEMQI